MIRIDSKRDFDQNDLLAVVVFQRENAVVWGERTKDFPQEILTQAREDGFQGKPGGSFLVRPAGSRPARRVLLLCAGKRSESDVHTLRRLAATAAARASDARLDRFHFLVPDELASTGDEVQAIVEGLQLGSYRFDRYKTKPLGHPSVRQVTLVVPRSPGDLDGRIRQGLVFSEAVSFARDLINEPPSQKIPETLGKIALKLAGNGLRARVYHKNDIQRLKMEALLGVNRGSAHPPVFVHLHYKPSGRPRKRIALVGKGITFDSGGLSLKTADGMMTMKYDMSGAATVFAVMRALAQMKVPVEAHGLAPITENMPGQDACKPGDVVRAANGKTIEVLNTDAEGRVILSDALSYASRLNVDEIIDAATLTGAVTIALGRAYAGLMTNNEALGERLKQAASKSGEKIWPLPLENTYKEHIKSKVADLKNIGNPGEAGTIIGGLFLQEFVGDVPWAHLDIASCAWSAPSARSSGSYSFGSAGATGVMVRTLLHYLVSI